MDEKQNSDSRKTVNEPPAAYNASKNITISNTFEESENSQLDYWAGLSPEQRFAGFYELMQRFYTFDKPVWSTKRIIIDVNTDNADYCTLRKE